jgi:hypothetical protein
MRGHCDSLSTVLSGHQTVSLTFSSTVVCARTPWDRLRILQGPSGTTPLPLPLPPFIQVGRKPRINSSGGAKRTQKPTPHPGDGDCFYLINKTCRTQAQKCRLSTTSTRHSRAPLARRREWVEQEERHNARYQSARRLRFPPATATAGLAIQPKGPWYEKRTCRKIREGGE